MPEFLRNLDRTLLAVMATLVVVVIVGLAVYTVVSSDSETPPTPAEVVSQQKTDDGKLIPGEPTAVDYTQLKFFQESVGHPVYWIGGAPKFTYELTQTTEGNVFVRYLPTGVKTGDKRSTWTTVGSYPSSNALEALTENASKKGMESAELENGGLAAWETKKDSNIYVAYPNVKVLIEVYDPDPARALKLATDGVVPVS